MHRGYRISFTLIVIGIVGFLFWHSAQTIPSIPVTDGDLTAHLSGEENLGGEIGPREEGEENSATSSIPVLEGEDGVYEVSYTEAGFSPSVVVIHVGDKIIFRNESANNFSVASNPHPKHTDLKNFDSKKALKPGESYEFTFTRAGTWRYHNDLRLDRGGTVTVLK